MKKIVEKITIFLLIALSIYISISSLGYIGDSHFFKQINVNPYVINILGVVLLFLIINAIYYILKKFQLDKSKKTTIIAFVVIIILQLLFVINLKNIPINDSGIVFDEAISMLEDNDVSRNIHWQYFQRNTQNQFFVILSSFIYRIAQFLNITNFLMVKNVANIIAIDLFIFFAYKTVQKIKGNEAATKFIIFAMFNPLIYIMAPYMYTNTISLPFLAGIILAFVQLMQSDTNKKRIKYSIILGIVSAMAFYVRVTTFISLIAIFIYLICHVNKVNKENIKNIIIYILLFICSFVLIYFSGSLIKKQYIKDFEEDRIYPVTHWIMMGAKYPGTYDGEDVAYTKSFGTYEEKIDANMGTFFERLKTNGILGNIKLIGKKMDIVWGQGTNKYMVVLDESQEYNSLYKYVIGTKGDFVAYYAQVYRALTFLLIVISILNYIKNNKNDMIFVNYLTLLGAILFFIIWEANKTYGMSFMPILMIIACDGIDVLSEFLYVKKPKKTYNVLLSISLITCILLLGFNFNNFTQKGKYEDVDFSVNQTKSSYTGNIRIYGKKKLVQTFTTSKPFNKIELKLKNPRKVTGVKCRIKIYDENNNLLKNKTISSEDIVDTEFTIIPFRTIRPKGTQTYKLKIYVVGDTDYNKSINILSYRSKYYDKVESGTLTSRNRLVKGDLVFKVYDNKIKPYFSKKVYVILSCCIVLSIVTLMYFYNKAIIGKEE